VHHYKPESKALSVASKRPKSTVAKKFKIQPPACKIIFTLFGDMKGAILVNSTPKGPDTASRDFHMFGPMKEALKGRRFSSHEEEIGAVRNWLKTKPKKLFLTEFKKNVKRWNR
jgi:hypothetical protein